MKEGISSFLFDVDCSTALKLLEAEYGLCGFGVIVKLWQKIFGERGYYIEFTRDVALLFANELGMNTEKVSEIVERACERGIFCEELYEKYGVLTSATIQEKYLIAANRRKNLKLIREYLLIGFDEIPEKADIKSLNVNILEENANIFETRKGKESKVKESKAKGARVAFRHSCSAPPAVGADDPVRPIDLNPQPRNPKNLQTLSPEDKNALSKEFGENTANAYKQHFEKYCKESGKSYKSPLETVRLWILKDKANEKPRGKSGKFCNYKDTNKIDFAAYEEQVIKEMLA